MNVAVISDVHGNRHALAAVLDDIAQHNFDQIWCLGDTVGYGAQPDECVELIRNHSSIVLAGNHDLGVIGKISLAQFSDAAMAAAIWTQGALSERSVEFLSGLEPAYEQGEICGLFHASPRDPVWEYLLSPQQAQANFELCPRGVILVGHSHVALAFHGGEHEPVIGQSRGDGEIVDISAGRWIVNPGSVGQPRDGDARAAWLGLDLSRHVASFHRVRYDVRGAAKAIRAAGLPASLAQRLKHGK